MKIKLQTNRLILREFELSDANSFYMLNADKEVMKYTGDSSFKSVEEAETFIAHYIEKHKNGFGRWTVIEKESMDILGWCGLKKHEEEFVDLGYRFHQTYWGKGYATEAAKACIQYAFNTLNLEEIIGRSSMENLASIGVLEKCNMRFWKKDECKGIPNSVYYKITKQEYFRNE